LLQWSISYGDDVHAHADDELNVVDMFFSDGRQKKAVSGDADFCDKGVIFQQNVECVFVGLGRYRNRQSPINDRFYVVKKQRLIRIAQISAKWT
jgi:hypothetical protein